ncbi:L-histidine N(alpha)-methyltransferase [Acidipila sp. 4G-K13]|uniref:L-histidine N(Alpha)-methyltransferase n=2 Tax=Paracidobacterium acidisoli TaxID=2303751 RepID=A0A372INU9_9BACT|nr:L-histidine N(alpha)-methyltransferase [Paracidobacterium acidisoli]
MTSSLPRLPEAASTPIGSEVWRGLTSFPKSLSPWLFYDEEGSRLFEAITELPEYYPTRTERGIFARYADEMIAACGMQDLTLVELGAGTATKTGLLLEAAVRRQGSLVYHPIDVSESALGEATRRIEAEIPGVSVCPRVADYTQGLGSLDASSGQLLILYIGSSIGNFEPQEAVRLLRGVRRQIAPGDRLLLGVDMVKDRGTLCRAYDDAAGVTAAFNMNVLTRINCELGASFRTKLFRHRARWNEQYSRMEMHLESLLAQTVAIPALDLEIRFARGESIHTENSYKFTDASVTALLEQGGFHVSRSWTDEAGWFGVYMATA